jgi:uncharacterized Zn finger protein
MDYFGWKPYVSVASRKLQAVSRLAKLKKKGRLVAPVTIEGHKIAASFWGISWCNNLERYSDFETRLPRGRSYVRNGLVVDLQIAKGEVTAIVSGSELYDVKVTIAPVAGSRWQAICRDCAGAIDSLVELLQGRLAKGVMDRVCREGDGLFPAPDEIKLSCSCPDWADMCKHVAAALYGIGARLDERPQLLFVLRGVDENEMLAGAGQDLAISKSAPAAAKVLDDSDVAALFGLEMAEPINSGVPVPTAPKPSRRTKAMNDGKASTPTKALAAQNDDQPRRARSKVGSRRKAKIRAGKKRARRRVKLST